MPRPATSDRAREPGGLTVRGVPDWVAETVGSVSDAERLRAGFTNESWAVATADGRRLVVTRMTDPGAAGLLLDRAPTLTARLVDAGIASPIPIPERSDRSRNVVTSAFVNGAPGMDLMPDDVGAALVGRIVGAAWLALEAVDASGLGLDDLWARPSELARAALAWLEPVSVSLGPRAATRARARIADLASLLKDRPTGFVHGDLVPANVLILDGAFASLTDLETVRIGERLLDAAWFRWIVRYHHPAIEPAAWAGFVAASQLDTDDDVVSALLDVLPVIRILEILAGPAPGAARARWMELLRAGVEGLSA